jgi:uncharacterized SAM-binding protein YcdF (DUF218 family)
VVIVRHLLETLLNPFFLCWLLLGVFLILLWLYGDSFIVRCGFLLVVLLFLLCSTGWLPQLVTQQLEDQYPAIMKIDPAMHWVVVFSGGQSEIPGQSINSLLYSASIKRLLEGIRLYKQLPRAKLLLSGGGYGFELPEAVRMAELASWCAVQHSNIILEKGSINTADQVKAIQDIVHEAPFYLVTSAIHMPRAMALCQAQGLHPIAAPTDFTFYWHDKRWGKFYLPNPHNLFYLSIAMHELLGRLWVKLYGV